MAGEDPEYVAWIRKQPCCACGSRVGVDAHHHTAGSTQPTVGQRGRRAQARGMGQRAHDEATMPLCDKLRGGPGCHQDLHEFRGLFSDMDNGERRLWQDRKVREFRALYQQTQEEPAGNSVAAGGPRPVTGSYPSRSAEPAKAEAECSSAPAGSSETKGIDARKCRSCGAPIKWIAMGSGKWAPVDLPGRRMVAELVGGGEIVLAYTSHLETCTERERRHNPRNPPRAY